MLKNLLRLLQVITKASNRLVKAYLVKITFSLINECEFYLSRRNILNNNFGFFNNNDARKICDSLFLEDNVPNEDFLIDAIDETSFTR